MGSAWCRRDGSKARQAAVVCTVVAFIVVLALGVVDAGRQVVNLGARRDEALARRSEPVDVAGDVAGAYRRASDAARGRSVRPGLRRRNRQPPEGRLSAGRPLVPIPAVATDVSDADVVMVFGEPPCSPTTEGSTSSTACGWDGGARERHAPTARPQRWHRRRRHGGRGPGRSYGQAGCRPLRASRLPLASQRAASSRLLAR